MSLNDLKIAYFSGCLLLGLVILSPTLAMFVQLPSGEAFSEFWILGAGHMAEDYPFNVENNTIYKIYLGIGNRMGQAEYYRVQVKLRNQTESFPNTTLAQPSELAPIVMFEAFVARDMVWEREVFLSFKMSFEVNVSKISEITINSRSFQANSSALWDAESNGFYFQLFFELWIFDGISSFNYHNRFVGLWMNATTA